MLSLKLTTTLFLPCDVDMQSWSDGDACPGRATTTEEPCRKSPASNATKTWMLAETWSYPGAVKSDGPGGKCLIQKIQNNKAFVRW